MAKINFDRFTSYERFGDSRTVYARGEELPIIIYDSDKKLVRYSTLALSDDSAKYLLVDIAVFEGFAGEEMESTLNKCEFREMRYTVKNEDGCVVKSHISDSGMAEHIAKVYKKRTGGVDTYIEIEL